MFDKRFGGMAALAMAIAMAPAAASASCDQPAPEPVSFIDLPGNPYTALPTKDGCTIFVSLIAGDAKAVSGVAVLHRDGGKVSLVRVFPVAGGLTDMVMARDERWLIVTNGTGVTFFDIPRLMSGAGDPTLGAIEDAVGIPPDTAKYMGPQRVAQTHDAGASYVGITADEKFVFVADEWTEAITVIDLSKGIQQSAIVGRIPMGVLPIAVTPSRDGKYLYTTSQIGLQSYGWPVECRREGADATQTQPVNPQGAIIVVDIAKAKSNPADAVVAKIPAGCAPVRLVISANGRTAYVTARNSNALLAFDTARFLADPAHALIGQVPVGTSPVGVGVIQQGPRVIVTNSNRFGGGANDKQTLTIIDPAKVASGKDAVVGSIDAGSFPREIRITADQRTMLVTNFGSKNLEIIDLMRLPK